MKRPCGELAIFTMFWAVAGAVLSCLALGEGKIGFALVYALLTVGAACLWFGIWQAKWGLVAYFAIAAFGGFVLLVAQGFEWRTLIQLVVAIYSIQLLLEWNGAATDDRPHEVRLSPKERRLVAYLQSPEGRAAIERRSRERAEIRRWEVMLELPTGQTIAAPEIAEKASRAFGCRFVVNTKPLDPVDVAFLASKENGPIVDGNATHFFCGLPPYLFEISQVDRFLFVQYVPSATYSKELEDGYCWTAKLAAEFAGVSPMSVKLGSRAYRAPDPVAIAKAMRSPDPEAVMEPFSVDGGGVDSERAIEST